MATALPDLDRFTDAAVLILTSLAGGPKHGYAIVQDVEALARVRLGPGTLYAALPRLEERGLIAPLPSGDRRRPYQLTEAGRIALREHLASMQQIAATGLERLAAR